MLVAHTVTQSSCVCARSWCVYGTRLDPVSFKENECTLMNVFPLKAVTSLACLIMHPSLKSVFLELLFRVASGVCDIVLTILSDSKSSRFLDGLDL